MNEAKLIRESLISTIDSKFKSVPTNVAQIINLQNNEITLKEWQLRVSKASNINEVENIITIKENG
jgi:hypothetical protein